MKFPQFLNSVTYLFISYVFHEVIWLFKAITLAEMHVVYYIFLIVCSIL